MPIHGKQHPDCQRKPINYDRDTTLPAAVASFRSATKKYLVLRTRLQYDINVQQEREKKRQAVVFVSSFHPRGGVFCCSWRDGAGVFFFRGGTGRLLFFSEAGRGGFFFFF